MAPAAAPSWASAPGGAPLVRANRIIVDYEDSNIARELDLDSALSPGLELPADVGSGLAQQGPTHAVTPAEGSAPPPAETVAGPAPTTNQPTEEDPGVASAIAAIEAGDLKGARKLLQQAITHTPENSLAWQWLAVVADTSQEKQRCLYRALSIDPDNGTAFEALRRLFVDEHRPFHQTEDDDDLILQVLEGLFSDEETDIPPFPTPPEAATPVPNDASRLARSNGRHSSQKHKTDARSARSRVDRRTARRPKPNRARKWVKRLFGVSLLLIALSTIVGSLVALRLMDAKVMVVHGQSISSNSVFTTMPMPPTPTATPVPTSTSPTTTTPALTATPTIAPAPTSTSSAMPAPTSTTTRTREPATTRQPSYYLEQRQRICEPERGRPRIEITVQTKEGAGIPGSEIWVIWSGGADRFTTGLKPELGLGYADFDMTPGLVYAVAVGAPKQQVVDLLRVEACSPDEEDSLLASWRLVIVANAETFAQ